MRKSLIAVTAVICAAVFQVAPAQSAQTHDVPSMQPFQCDNTDSMNVGKFVTDGSFEPLFLQTVVHGDTCGDEGATITNVSGTQFVHLDLQIQGTQNDTGFGPYIQIYYNGGASVAQIPIKTGQVAGNPGGYTERRFKPQDFGLTKGEVIDHLAIITNPTTGENGKCLIRQLHVNSVMAQKKVTVVNACP